MHGTYLSYIHIYVVVACDAYNLAFLTRVVRRSVLMAQEHVKPPKHEFEDASNRLGHQAVDWQEPD